MRQPNVTVYGSRQCPDTSRAIARLEQHSMIYEFKDIDESPEYDGYVAEVNGGKRVIPVLRVDNEILINPSEQEIDAIVSETP